MKLFSLLTLVFLPLYASPPAIVPMPHAMEFKEGVFALSKNSRIVFSTRERNGLEGSLEPLARVLGSELESLTGIRPLVVPGEAREGDIVLRFADMEGDMANNEAGQIQSYTLDASSKQVVISSPYYKGVAYGTATFIQLFDGMQVHSVSIQDQATAAYRAVMLDVARQVHSLEVIKDVIRMARLYKLRYLHLHLTDDQNFTFPFEPITGNLEGNFAYTKQELLELVAYADARGITLIPEMDLPGHSTKLKESGYLGEAKSDYDVAGPQNYEKVGAVIEDMMEVFKSSPYFHIGGDESGAGKRLVPFLAAANKVVRKAGRRLLVWEGFHGAPILALPATGEDRIIVMAWESTYNAPWDLLESGYELINASWRPLYIVGAGNPVHPGSTGGRKFPAEEIYHWDKNTFMHWEPGRPVYEDRGPNDAIKGDHEWSATNLGKEDQMIGGQLLFWEQSQETVMNDLRGRLEPMAERLWNPDAGQSFEEFSKRSTEVAEKILGLVQPVEIVLEAALPPPSPVDLLYQPYRGDETKVRLLNRTQIEGEIRFVNGSFSNSKSWVDFKDPAIPSKDGEVYRKPLVRSKGFGLRAQLFRKDGMPVEGQAWGFFNNWTAKVKVTEYDIGPRTQAEVFDMASLPDEKIIGTYELPMLRGPLRNNSIRGQKLESVFTAPESGDFVIQMKTQSGHATLYLDANQNGKWEAEEVVIANTPNTEKPVGGKVTLKKEEKYALRVDHNTGMPRPVVIVTIEGAGMEKAEDVSAFLSLPEN